MLASRRVQIEFSDYSTPAYRADVYLYIDAGNIAGGVQTLFRRYCGLDGMEIGWARFKRICSADRAFYYECSAEPKLLKRLPQDGRNYESLSDAEKLPLQPLFEEVMAQRKHFEYLRSLPGMHLRQGLLKTRQGSRNEQKMVDVQLAVDMLTHAYSGACKTAILASGDADMVPVVEALVQMGTWVTVISDAATASRELLDAADEVYLLEPKEAFQILTHESKQRWQYGPDSFDYSVSLPDGTFPSPNRAHEYSLLFETPDSDHGKLYVHRPRQSPQTTNFLAVCGTKDRLNGKGYVSDTRLTPLISWLKYKRSEIQWPDEQTIVDAVAALPAR